MVGRGSYGIFITKLTVPLHDGEKRVHYEFYGGKRYKKSRPDYWKKGEFFVTSKAINNALAEKALAELIEEKRRFYIGYIEYKVNTSTKKLGAWNYYPLAQKEMLGETLGKIGLASHVELRALKDLLKEHGNYTYVSGFSIATRKRKNQLRSQERTKTMPLKETIRHLEDYIASKRKENPQSASVKRGGIFLNPPGAWIHPLRRKPF